MGVVKSKYWRKRKIPHKDETSRSTTDNDKVNIAPRQAPKSNTLNSNDRSYVEQLLSLENYEYYDPNREHVRLFL